MRATASKQTYFGVDILLFSLLLTVTAGGHSVWGALPVFAADSGVPAIAIGASSSNELLLLPSSTQRHHGCVGSLDMPLSIDLSTDPTKLVKGAATSVSGVITAQAALKNVHVRVRAKGNAEILPGAVFDYDFLAQGQIVNFTIPVRFKDVGISQVVVDVTAVVAGTEFPFGKRAEFNVLLRPEQILTGREVPRHLQIRAIRQDLQAGRITQELADVQVKNLTKLEGTFDQTPYEMIEPTPQQQTLIEGLRLPVTEARDPNKRPSARGSVSLRVRGLVQWRDENNVNHPVYGMTVQVRDDESVGSELVRVMATDTNGQYDTGWFTQDDGWLAGNPDIFVRFRSENSVIDVEDGCFLCGTYENDTAVHNEFPGGEIIENFTCANTGTGPACSVLTGLTWIALYAHNLNNNNWLGKIRADWPGDTGSANYGCTPACRLNIRPGDKWDWDVLHHEYGHYVMDEFDFEDNPGNTHYLSSCHAIDRTNKDDGMKLAWGEGWPTFFGTAGQWQLNMASLNVPRVGDVNYSDTEESSFSYSLEDNTGGIIPSWGQSGRGEDNELAVQRVFWDLVDTNSDSRDVVSVSDKTLFDIVDVAGPHSLNAAWAPIRATLSNADDIAYGGILTDHLIGPTPLSPMAGAIVTQSNASFSWDANVGCDTSFAGNSFNLIFYKPGAIISKILTISGLTTTSYTLRPDQFTLIAAQGPPVIWAVEASNTAGPATGPYLGAGSLVYFYSPPANNDCTSAVAIGDGTAQGTTFGATSDGQSSCNLIPGADAWYSYQATCNGFLNLDTQGSPYNTVVSVYDGCPGTYQNEIACNRTCSGQPRGITNSCLTGSRVPVTQGQTYLIRVGGWVQDEGDFTLHVSCMAQADSCSEATNVAIGSTTEGSTVGASVDPAPTCDNVTVTAPGVWYTVYGTGNEMTASLCDAATNFDTKISVYCGGCGNRDCRAADDDACTANRSEVTWCSAPGAIYHILVHGFGTDMGDFKLRLTDTGTNCGPFYLACFPSNNSCSTAIDISGTIIGDNTGTSTTGSASCVDSQNDVWYRYTPNCNGILVISTCGTQGTLADTVLSVYDECGGQELACNDDGGGTCLTRAKIEMPVTADKPLLIRVADYGTGAPDQGTFPLSFSMRVAPVTVSPPGFYVTPSDGAYNDHLLRLDTVTNTVVDIGPLGMSSVWGLAFDSNLGIMFGVSSITDQLVTVDLTTGTVTPVGSIGFNNVETLGFDSSSNTLYGVDQFTSPQKLVTIDPVSEAGIALSNVTGSAYPEALAFDPVSGQLYGASRTSLGMADNLATIDVATGAGSIVGSFGGDFDSVTGLAFDTATGLLYGTQADQSPFDGRLMRIDKATGVATQVGGTYAEMGSGGFEIVPGLPDATVNQPYTGRIPITGGCPPYGLANVTGLPGGLSTNGHDTILGTPTESGNFTITFDVGDSDFSTSSISVSLPLRVRPENDDCAQAQSVSTGDTPFTTLGALTDGPVEQALCTFSGDPRIQQDVWFCHQATCTGHLTASVCGSDYDTKLAVYDGCTCPTSASAVACNDDYCGTSGLQSEVTTPVTSGQSYLIRVGGFSGNAGSGTLSISCVECTLDAECNDGDLCTDDVCVNGTCTFNFKTCDDGNLCTTDACAPATGCSNTPIRCDDQNICTTEACNPATGICDVSPISCDDSNQCTTDSCDPTQGCVNTPVACDDGNACTDDACDGATGQCVTPPISCDDLNPCTTDACDPATGCTHTFGGQPNTDCNGNGTDDACDIFSGTSLDCNGNDIPDECEIGVGGIIAFWHFDEQTGSSVAQDSVGSTPGVLSGSAEFVPGGISGNAVSVTVAGNGFVDMGDLFGFTAGDFTVVAWFQMNPGDAGQYNIVAKHAAGWVNGYALSTGTGWGYGQPDKAYFYDSATGGAEPISTTTVNDGIWHQVVGVYTQGGMAELYVDGAPVEDAKPALPIGGNTAHFLIGGSGAFGTAAPVGAYNGLVDEVQVYDHALTSGEVQYLFENPDGSVPTCDWCTFVGGGAGFDCNGNGVRDECDIRTGAEYQPLDFSAYHNGNLQGVDPGFPSGNVVLGGVPFDIPTTPNNYWHSAAEIGPNPRAIDIPVNRFGVSEVHTLINNYWGQPGPTAYAWLEFFGSNGAYYRKDLIGNEDIRDFNQLFFTNNINGTTTTNVVMVGSHRLDKQTIALPADFLDETLLQIKVSDNGGDNFQRIFLAGITTHFGGSLDCNANQIPDECDIAEGVSLDIDGNTVPDECEHCGWVDWPISAGGNGHYYLSVHTPAGISWDDASLAAAMAGGYLASIHSSAENDFVFNLIDAPRFWLGPDAGYYEGPWLGGFQPTGSVEPAGGWTWDSGEPWTYTNWGPGQPDNFQGAQNWMAFFAPPGATRTNLWDDAVPAYRAYGYVIETDDAHAVSDCDGDGDVDELDYRCFVQCLTGPGGGLPIDCCRYDYDGDFDVDTKDFSVFQSVYMKASRVGCAVPPPGLIGWWPGDGNANDIIGGNDASALNGATYSTGFVNQAFSFDGLDDSIVSSLAVGITGNAPRTLCAWIKSASAYPTTCCPTPLSWGSASLGGCFGSFISNGQWYFWGCADDIRTTATVDLAWHHHCMTYDAPNATYFLDGNTVGNQLKSLSTGSSPLVIGNGFDTSRSDTFFNGLVDEVQLYNRALSTQEVRAIYDAGTDGTCRP